jgi:hypothetical protein
MTNGYPEAKRIPNQSSSPMALKAYMDTKRDKTTIIEIL